MPIFKMPVIRHKEINDNQSINQSRLRSSCSSCTITLIAAHIFVYTGCTILYWIVNGSKSRFSGQTENFRRVIHFEKLFKANNIKKFLTCRKFYVRILALKLGDYPT